MEEDRLRRPDARTATTGVPTVDTAGFVTAVRTVVDLVTLLGAVDAGAVTALELVGTTRQQGCKRRTNTNAHRILNPLLIPAGVTQNPGVETKFISPRQI